MRYKRKKRNAPIATLIKNYTNKKSGKVSESREEIKWRFNWLDWKDQKRIIAAFLESGKSDREWAYGKVLDYWDDSFLPKVKELWHVHSYSDDRSCCFEYFTYTHVDACQFDYSLQFLIDLIGNKADADMRLYPPFCKVEHRTHVESPF